MSSCLHLQVNVPLHKIRGVAPEANPEDLMDRYSARAVRVGARHCSIAWYRVCWIEGSTHL